MTATQSKLPGSRGAGAAPPKGAEEKPVAGRKRQDPVKGDTGLFGQHLEALVNKAGLTALEFAEKIGKDRNTVTLYFSGRRMPKPSSYRHIAHILGLSSIRELVPDLPPKASKPKRSK